MVLFSHHVTIENLVSILTRLYPLPIGSCTYFYKAHPLKQRENTKYFLVLAVTSIHNLISCIETFSSSAVSLPVLPNKESRSDLLRILMEPEGNTEEKKLTNEQNKTQVKSLNS